jgi:hypothetical protein
MPSWSAAEEQNEQAESPPATDATLVEAARRLLETLFSEPQSDERPLQPER